ncbi:MAG TPA: transposase [Myxococcales bacterium]|jgi:REP element-mobilizing transposase RayT|nr:transposase [Myxococcales bacterium]
MAYPVRHFDPQTVYFLTSRTMQSRFLMAPSDKTNELIGGILARAVRQCEVELFAYVFTSNHFHAMVRAPSAIAMSKFMQRLQSNIAIKVGRLVGWRGRFFARRYSAEPIVDEAAQVGRLVYILSHGVKEGLVSEVKKWPGLSCVQALLEGGAASPQRWRNWTHRWKMEVGKKITVGRFSDACPSEPESITLTSLPAWTALSTAQRGELVAQLVAEIDATAPNKSKVSAEHIVAQDPLHRPERSKHTPRPKAHASITALRIEAVRRYRAFLEAFRHASRLWLAGSFDAIFPKHCFRPPTWSVPSKIV